MYVRSEDQNCKRCSCYHYMCALCNMCYNAKVSLLAGKRVVRWCNQHVHVKCERRSPWRMKVLMISKYTLMYIKVCIDINKLFCVCVHVSLQGGDWLGFCVPRALCLSIYEDLKYSGPLVYILVLHVAAVQTLRIVLMIYYISQLWGRIMEYP